MLVAIATRSAPYIDGQSWDYKKYVSGGVGVGWGGQEDGCIVFKCYRQQY